MESHNNNNGSSGRLRFVDIAKGISIICIILGHLEIHAITRVVFTFHVPIFFLITGYFVSTKMSVRDFAAKKARMLLVPYYVTSLVMILVAAGIGLRNGNMCGSVMEWTYAALELRPYARIVMIGALFAFGYFTRSLFSGPMGDDRRGRGASGSVRQVPCAARRRACVYRKIQPAGAELSLAERISRRLTD